MKTTSLNRYKIKSLLKKQHGVDLTEPQLDTIEEIYIENKIDFRIALLFKRLINLFFGLFMLIFFFLIRNQPEQKWIFVILVSIYILYNLILTIRNVKRFQKAFSKRNGNRES